MSAPFDVLAEVAHAAQLCEGQMALALQNVHVAVAELIDAAGKLADYPTTSRRDRVHALLARIGSAS